MTTLLLVHGTNPSSWKYLPRNHGAYRAWNVFVKCVHAASLVLVLVVVLVVVVL